MNFPHERERLYKLLRDTRAGGVVLLSGDRHLAELSVTDAGLGYPLFDLTSSGLNQGSPKIGSICMDGLAHLGLKRLQRARA